MSLSVSLSVTLSVPLSVALDALIVPSVSSGNPQQDTHAAVSENRSHTKWWRG